MAQDHDADDAPAMDYDTWLGREPHARRGSSESTNTSLSAATQRRRSDWRVVRHSIDRPDWEPVEGEKHYLATVIWTLAWYAVPLTLFATWVMAFDDDSGTACAAPVHNVCPPMRTTVLDAMMGGLPRVCVALVISLLLALLIRLGSGAWRPVTAAFAAAVIGAGAATILFTVLAS
jgi:hypothetical protein